MKVSELAKKLKTSDDDVLKVLRSMKLKAKDGDQELSAAVVSVVKSALKKDTPEKSEKAPAKKKAVTKKKAATTKKTAEKKEKTEKAEPKKKTVTKKKVVKKKDAKTVKKVIKKKVVKKVVKKKVVAKKATTKKEAEQKASEKTEEKAKPKKKVSKEPMVMLRPLARKRKKSRQDDDAPAAAQKSAVDTSAEGEASTLAAPTIPQGDLPEIEIKVPITVKDFANRIDQKPGVVLKSLMKKGLFAHINQALGAEIVEQLTQEFGFTLAKIKTQEEQLIETHKQEEEDPSTLKGRAPVITFMGHVDHGKTSLIDKIRKTKIADKEHGGITQHMGAYTVEIEKGKITILDTPGHEAFTAMRSRSAHITDLVVIVVAADEGIMPQTEEAIDHARAANVPMVVAMNKMDRPNADPDRVKKQLMEHDLATEDWGGKTVCIGVSAHTGEGIDELLEMILLESEMLELKANPDKLSSGIVVEAHLSQGKGAVATLIVQSGTLRDGDFVVVGPYYGKIRAMFDDHHRKVTEAGPSMAVEVLGLPNVPDAGETFYVVEDEKVARDITFRRSEDLKNERLHSHQKITLEDIYAKAESGEIKELNVIIKSDVQGSLEALKDSLSKIPSNKVRLKFIHFGVGDVNVSDVLLAQASNAIIIAFHVGIGAPAKEALEKDPVDVREYRIIYDAVNDIRNALEGMLEAKTKKNVKGRVEIRQVFKLTKHGIVAGCYVTKGKVDRKSHVDIIRGEDLVFSGKISTLKRFKDDVKEVGEGFECGIAVEGYTAYEAGDIIEAYDLEHVAQTL